MNNTSLYARSITNLGLAAVLTIFIYGCTTMKIPKEKVRTGDSYKLKAESDGLLIAVKPLTEDEIDETFNMDLLDIRILPILVIAENQHKSASFILEKDKVAVVGRLPLDKFKSGMDEISSNTTGDIITLSGMGLLALPLVVTGMKLSSDAQVKQHNIDVKKFQTHTLSPGQKTHGFIFLQFPENSSTTQLNFQVLLEAVKSVTHQPTTFNFPINYSLP